jgi:hypothetical protein
VTTTILEALTRLARVRTDSEGNLLQPYALRQPGIEVDLKSGQWPRWSRAVYEDDEDLAHSKNQPPVYRPPSPEVRSSKNGTGKQTSGDAYLRAEVGSEVSEAIWPERRSSSVIPRRPPIESVINHYLTARAKMSE